MGRIKILGDSFFPNTPLSFLVEDHILIDAGNAIRPLGKEIAKIDTIILTHAHMDHIMEVPLIVDMVVWSMGKHLTIYGIPHTVETLKKHIFNNSVWPSIPEELMEIRIINGPFRVGDTEFIPVEALHTIPTTGFVIDRRVYITGDTAPNRNLIEAVKTFAPEKLVVDVSWPSDLEKIARITKHICTTDLEQILQELQDYLPEVYAYHQKPTFYKTTAEELKKLPVTIAKPGMEL